MPAAGVLSTSWYYPGTTDSGSSSNTHHVRPQFNSQRTDDRLRFGSRSPAPAANMHSKIQKGRRSIFKEEGLVGDNTQLAPTAIHARTQSLPCKPHQRTESNATIEEWKPSRSEDELERLDEESDNDTNSEQNHQHRRKSSTSSSQPWYAKLAQPRLRPRVKSASGAPPKGVLGLQRFALVMLLICIILPSFSYHTGRFRMDMSGADAGVIRKREDSPTDICTRWAHQSAQINGTMYIYGGEAKLEEGQEENTWNNYFLTLDLNRDWSIESPRLTGLPVPDGPPPVALGYLWQDYNNLYLYGGQFSDSPYVSPAPESLWRYSIKDEEWTEFPEPRTSKGNYSSPANEPVHRAAEGAGLSVPELGLSWYFGGHLDWATTPGWSTSIDRVYIKSLLEFTHPGYMNTGLEDLADGSGAGRGGAFRNITDGGVQQADAFPERADGVLVYVPGWGEMGVLIGLAGGTNDTFVDDLSTLDVYDLANSEWYHQETDGDAPGVRVNPCAVVATAPDASSFQIYMFGGQNLQPYEEQIQYDDMYILTIPSFTWIKVEADDSTPHPRAGHTCTLRDGQIVVVGGYVGEDIPCDSPGIYVFDASELKWKDEFKAGDHESGYHPENSVLGASYGYRVPDAVIDVIGGDEEGGATATTPAVGEASDGPFATGQPPVVTVTQPGATATVTGPSAPESTDDGEDNGGGDDGPPAGLIAAGAIAGVAGLAAAYLGFCAWVYRRQVGAYKQHVATTNRYTGASTTSMRSPTPLAAAALLGGKKKKKGEKAHGQPAEESDETFGWVGSEREQPAWLSEPKWYSDDTGSSPGFTSTAYGGSGSAIATAPRPSMETTGARRGSGSGESTEGLLDGQEPSFFNVVLAPRRALRVVNGVD